MKFENIKEGDTVYVRRKVRFGYRSSAAFWVPAAVERTTATQFTAGGNRYTKSSGGMLGGGLWCYAKLEGDEGVYDQSSEMEELKSKLILVTRIRDFANGLHAVEHDNSNLKEVCDLVSRAVTLLEEGKQ